MEGTMPQCITCKLSHVALPLAGQASIYLALHAFVLNLIAGKIRQFHGIPDTQPWEGHNLRYSHLQPIALGGVGGRHDDEGALADERQLEMSRSKDTML